MEDLNNEPVNVHNEEPVDVCNEEVMEGGNEEGDPYTPSVDAKFTPSIGLEFDSVETAYKFYNDYAKLAGFSVRKEYNTKCKIDGVVLNRKYVCNKQGKRPKDKRTDQVKHHRREIRIGCGAQFYISYNRNTNIWIVTKFTVEHNHLLHVPMCAQFMSSHRNLTLAQAVNAKLAVDTGISLKASHGLMSAQVGGREHLGFTREDLKGYLRGRRQRELEYGDAGSLMKYLQGKSLNNPFFYHSFQSDSAELITNIFWADHEMIKDYAYFGDVVSFDTTFRTNKDYRPFACFVGFNHFKETVVFGAALLYDETAASFEWLFENFLDAMSGKRPMTIFTDQDQAMAKAIAQVMPDVSHGLCTWHLRENAMKHLGHLYGRGCKFASQLYDCFYLYEDETELADAWQSLLAQYNLEENAWMKKTWELRSKWAYAYMKWSFTAGVRSTQLSESMNGKLRRYLKADHNINQFFTHFDRAIADVRFNELKSVYDAREKFPMLRIKRCPMLLKPSKFYSNVIFELFQDEYENSLSCQVEQCDKLDGKITYLVGEYGKEKRYKVWSNATQQRVHCSCRKFEYIGILCSHAIKVLDRLGIMELPDMYILPRWRMDAKDGELQENSIIVDDTDPKMVVSTRYRTLCPKVVGLVASASEHKGAFQYLSNLVDDACKQVRSMKLSKESGVGYNDGGDVDGGDVDPQQSQTRVMCLKKKYGGSKGKSRLKPWHDKNLRRKKKVSHPCNPSQDTQQSTGIVQMQHPYQQDSHVQIPHGVQLGYINSSSLFNYPNASIYPHGLNYQYLPIHPTYQHSTTMSSQNSNSPHLSQDIGMNVGTNHPMMFDSSQGFPRHPRKGHLFSSRGFSLAMYNTGCSKSDLKM